MDTPTEQVPAPVSDPLVGATLDGRYRIQGLIGRGGMAAVYRADDLALGRRVAVKVFTPATEGIDDDDRRRSETALLASLTHPALVTLFDAARDAESNREFLVMELVEGEDLREILRRGAIPRHDAARMLADLAEGLHVIHSRGIVHRDVKPANVLLAPAHLPTRRWNAKLADFGIARLLDESRLTATGRIIGTPGYLSPEQVRGEPVGSSADIYSLGLLLLEALTGEQPFPGPALESASARLVRDPVIPSELGPEWVDLLTGMTARDPGARPTALDVALAAQSLEVGAASAATTGDPLDGLPGGHGIAHAPAEQDEHDTRIIAAAGAADATGTPANDATAAMPAAAASAAVPPADDDDATAATRVLTVETVPGERPAAEPESAPAGRPRTRTPRWVLLAIAAGLALLAGLLLVPALAGLVGGADEPEPTPTPTPALPSVPGDLGVHLEQLEEAVTQ
ncbi:serine/threonine-protein kinase [Agromyces sp. NPDC056523]|uniref:serine/threonine-protein kinase n=1 Tax=Agromyces sp. NPDC056523 TaxID=3345850 RepID=UPI003670EC28